MEKNRFLAVLVPGIVASLGEIRNSEHRSNPPHQNIQRKLSFSTGFGSVTALPASVLLLLALLLYHTKPIMYGEAHEALP